jgi:hypothetical protein
MRTAHGVIVSSQVEPYQKSESSHGILTILTPHKEYLKFDVDAYTDYETLDDGENVFVEYDVRPVTRVLVAKKVLRKHEK